MNEASARRERGWLLARQGRHALAEQELGLALADDPDDAETHALLALVLADQEGRGADALRSARTAVGLAPDHPFPHYAEARVHLAGDRWEAAERSAREAVLVDPDTPEHFWVLGASYAGRERWKDALEAADQGLAIDPGHTGCANLRAMALVHLGRREEAGATLHGALSRDPENSHTHANQGWTLLHRGDRAGAMRHFREALRLEPENGWARDGLVEAIKAKNPLYAGMLRYFLWMQRLDGRTRWMVIVGGLVGYHVVRGVARANPALAPFLVPLLVAYGVFVLLSWTAPRMFDALLLASSEGRWMLSPAARVAARWMAGGIALALLAVGAGAAGLAGGWWTALLFAALLVPLAAVFRGSRTRVSRGLAVSAGVLYAMAFGAVALWTAGDAAAADGLMNLVLLGVAATTWLANLGDR